MGIKKTSRLLRARDSCSQGGLLTGVVHSLFACTHFSSSTLAQRCVQLYRATVLRIFFPLRSALGMRAVIRERRRLVLGKAKQRGLWRCLPIQLHFLVLCCQGRQRRMYRRLALRVGNGNDVCTPSVSPCLNDSTPRGAVLLTNAHLSHAAMRRVTHLLVFAALSPLCLAAVAHRSVRAQHVAAAGTCPSSLVDGYVRPRNFEFVAHDLPTSQVTPTSKNYIYPRVPVQPFYQARRERSLGD